MQIDIDRNNMKTIFLRKGIANDFKQLVFTHNVYACMMSSTPQIPLSIISSNQIKIIREYDRNSYPIHAI